MDSVDKHKKFWREYLVVGLIVANFLVWVAASGGNSDNLTVSFIDIGQGDAILIESPSGGRVLIDGGRNRQILTDLGELLPFGDRRIDVVIATHPDADHIGGLPEVVSRYDVGVLIAPDVESDNEIDDELDRRVVENGVQKLFAKRGMTINLGDGALLQVLYPDRDVSRGDTNDASVVAKLIYAEQTFLFTGDASISVENILLSKDDLDIDVLKVGHHGSRTSTSLMFAEATSPEYAIISAGGGNRYGHPHVEVLNILASVGAKIISTAQEGTIVFETDGESLFIK